MDGPRLLVARAEPEASKTASRIEALGAWAILAPMRFALPILEPPPARPDAVLATSAQAFALGAPIPSDWRALPCLVVGQVTGDAARLAGFGDLRAASGDVRDLQRLLGDFSGKTVVYLAGLPRRPELEAGASSIGLRLIPWLRYRMQDAAELPEPARIALAQGACDGVLHFSSESAATLLRLVERAGLSAALARAVHVCLSEAIASRVRAGLAPNKASATLLVAPQRSAEALIDVAIAACSHRSTR